MTRTPSSITLLLALAACGGRSPDPTAPDEEVEPFELARFQSCDELRAHAADAYVELLLQSTYGFGVDVVLEGSEVAPGDDDGGAGPTDWSDTNVQEEGVDEPDIVKTDGERLFVAEGHEVHVLRSWPAEESELLSTVALDGSIASMLLAGDRLAVFSNLWDEREERNGWRAPTRLTLLDVSVPEAPAILREIDLEGTYVDARRIGDDLYLVTDAWSDTPSGLWALVEQLDLPRADWDDEEAMRRARMEARARLSGPVRRFVDGMALEELLPMVDDSLSDGERVLVACTDVFRPYHVSRPSVLAVSHVDLAEGPAGSALSATGLMADGWTVYASRANLYVAQTSESWWFGADDEPTMTTRIHQFALEGSASIYRGSGRVDGWLLDAWSLSEHEGSLRVATTDLGWWWGGDEGDSEAPANNLFVLRPADDGHLEVVGEVRGIAPTEQITAARFMGAIGFLVTFRQTDPLFTLDLSDPTAPAVVGELEVPGFSSYLHPVGEDRLLAVGMDGDDTGRITGFQVSLFDVSDLAHPTRSAQLTVASGSGDGDPAEWSDSEALWDHHAFTFHRGVLSVPITTSGHDEVGEWTSFSGLWVIGVDAEGDTLTELGTIDHADLAAQSECPDQGYGDDGGLEGDVDTGTETEGTGDCHEWQRYAPMRRSVVIEDDLFSVSDYGVKVNALGAPEIERAQVVFHPLDETPEAP